MTTTDASESSTVQSAEPAQADARFAAFLDDMAAHVNDADGHLYSDFLNDEPEQQRALFDLVEEISKPRQPEPLPAAAKFLLATMVAAIAVVAIAMVAFR